MSSFKDKTALFDTKGYIKKVSYNNVYGASKVFRGMHDHTLCWKYKPKYLSIRPHLLSKYVESLYFYWLVEYFMSFFLTLFIWSKPVIVFNFQEILLPVVWFMNNITDYFGCY